MKKFLAIALTIITMSQLTGCASCERGWVDFKSDVSGGLNRTLTLPQAKA